MNDEFITMKRPHPIQLYENEMKNIFCIIKTEYKVHYTYDTK